MNEEKKTTQPSLEDLAQAVQDHAERIKDGNPEKKAAFEQWEHEYDVKFRAFVSYPYQPIGAAYIETGCCKNRPVLITVNKRTNGTLNFSCQCACGLWCTTGCDTASEALQHYERMSRGENLYGGFRQFEY